MYSEPKFLPAGDLSISVEFGEEIGPAVNARVLALEYLIQQKQIPGVIETVPTFRALLIDYDPLTLTLNDLITTLGPLIL